MMNFRHTIYYSLLTSTLFASFTASASINNIVFSGKWLIRPNSDTQTQYKINACQVPVFDYKNTPSGEKNALIEIAYNNQYKGGNCTYVPGTPTGGTPLTFPREYSYVEYLRLYPNSPKPESYFYLCDIIINNTLHTIHFVLEPIYECKSEGCYTNQSKCTADVAGRDLNIPGLGSLGHTGLTTKDAVLEVLNEDEIIQVNPLSEFKSKTEYWGRAYGFGKPGEIEIDLDQANAVISAGFDQTAYYPQYTLLPEYTEGHLKYNDGAPELVRGIFRCDTFVQYTYKKALNIELLPKEFYHTPTHQFSAIPFKRTNLSAQEQRAEIQPSEIYQKLVNVLDSSLTTDEKSTKILQESRQTKSNDDKVLIFDALRFTPSSNNIPFLLEKYDQASNSKERLMILSALVPSLQDAKKDGLSQNELNRIQDIYDAILKNQDDISLYERSIEDLPTVYGNKEAASLLRKYGPDLESETKKTMRRAYINTYFLTSGADANEVELARVVSLMNGCELQDHFKMVSSLVDMALLPTSTLRLFETQRKQNQHLENCPHSKFTPF